MTLKYEYAIQEIAESFVAIPLNDSNSDKTALIRLNECGRFIFECLQLEMDEVQILNRMEDEYDAPALDLKDGLAQFLSQLRAKGVIID